jgi:hypothetical protein
VHQVSATIPAPHFPPSQKHPFLLALLRDQVPQGQVVDHILHVLDSVLQPVALPPQDVVLQVEDLEACKHILHKLVDEQRTLVVTQCDGVTRKASLFRHQ